MASWRKLLAAMAADPKPVNYTYDEAAKVLSNLGFEHANKKSGTSHKKWRKKLDSGETVIVGLVDSGSGSLPREYIQDMIETLTVKGLLDRSEKGD